MGGSTKELYNEAEKKLRLERDRAVEKIKEELNTTKQKTLAK
tara:strand:- start:749 stop:874 length:126 start_codon:yes stop_codon:yes gene_type:complete